MSGELARTVDRVEADESQRARLYELIAEDPYRPHVKACRDAGIAGTGGQVRTWFKTDPDVQERLGEARHEYLKRKHLDIDTLLGKVSSIVHNDESQSQWRGIEWSLGVLHSMGARQAVQVEHTGADGGPVEVTVEHDYGQILDKLEQVGLIRRGAPQVVDAEAVRLLPARTD
jgi:hypothetical protein